MLGKGGGSSTLVLVTPRFLVGTSGYLPESSASFQEDMLLRQALFSLLFPPCLLQMSLEKSEKHRSEMRIRLGSQSGEPKAKSTHQV